MHIRNLWTAATLLLGLSSVACTSSDGANLGGQLQVTVSAEGLGANGYAFPPSAGQEVAFVDGWAVDFDRILVCIGNIRLSNVPDRNPGDQSEFGADVARRKGPFILDLKKSGNAQDKGGAGRVAIRLPIDDLVDLFDLEQRYAFSYDLVEATEDATFVNVDPDDADVVAMIEGGQRALLSGRATFKGASCEASVTDYSFESLPKTVDFRFGLRGKVSYLNCQNPDNSGDPIEGEESPRGIQLLPNAVTTAQITVHTDHLFWPTVSHESLPLFNQFAASATQAESAYTVDLEALKEVPVPGVTDGQGVPLPWRSCVDRSLYVLPSSPSTMTLETGSQALTNLYEFVQFNAATMGHLNADGLCFVK